MQGFEHIGQKFKGARIVLPFQNENPFSKEGGFQFCINNGSITNVRFHPTEVGFNPSVRTDLVEKKQPLSPRQRLFLFWWERVDSNHRSRRQQIYSLPPLATREHSHIKFFFENRLQTLKMVELVDGLEPPTC